MAINIPIYAKSYIVWNAIINIYISICIVVTFISLNYIVTCLFRHIPVFIVLCHEQTYGGT